ncbi:MAG: hypothetical protein ACU0DI_03655 [Paracoccaceae bacterium]
MRQTVWLTILPILLAAADLQAQEFVLDLEFDDAIYFEDAAADSAEAGPAISVILSYGADFLSGVTTETWALQLDLSDSHDLGDLGILDWSGHLALQDIGTPATATAGLDRLQLQNSVGNVSWQLGKYRIGWGEVEGIPVLDVVNSGLSVTSIDTPSAELPGQWFASVEVFAGNNTYSGFVGLAPEVAHMQPAAPARREYELGMSANIPINNGQVSLYGARLLPQSGVVELVTMTSSAEPYTLLGISAHRAIGAVLLEFDLAAKSGLQRAEAAGLSSHRRVDAALGIEYAASETAQISASVMAQHWLEQSTSYFDYGPDGAVASGQTTANYLLGASNSFLDDKLSVSVNVGGALDGSTTFGALSADYSVSDALKLSATITQIAADAGSLFEALDGAQTANLSAEYFF